MEIAGIEAHPLLVDPQDHPQEILLLMVDLLQAQEVVDLITDPLQVAVDLQEVAQEVAAHLEAAVHLLEAVAEEDDIYYKST